MKKKRRIVLKFGTGILTGGAGSRLDIPQIRRLASDIAGLVSAGHECIVVSSGSVGAGMMVLGFKERPKDTPSRQACAAIGQSRLMRQYEIQFHRHKLNVAQLLLTHQDMDSRTRYANAKNTLEHLLKHRNIVPIINENDTVAVEELRFGDNDRLSAEVAILANADLLVLLTSVDGLMRDDGEKKECVHEVTDMANAMALVTGEAGKLSVGGMATKLEAARIVSEHGVEVVIGSGVREGVLRRIVDGRKEGTRFRLG